MRRTNKQFQVVEPRSLSTVRDTRVGLRILPVFDPLAQQALTGGAHSKPGYQLDSNMRAWVGVGILFLDGSPGTSRGPALLFHTVFRMQSYGRDSIAGQLDAYSWPQ